MILIDKDFLSEDSKNFIENCVLSNKFPLFVRSSAVEGDNTKIMFHSIIERVEHEKNNVEHPYLKNFLKILNDFCNKHNITYNQILRMAVNVTFNNGISKECPIHVDHDFEHNQLLIYLNEPLDKKSATVILNDNDEITKKIYPEKYKGVFFGKTPHFMVYPEKGERYVMVTTFR